MIIVKNPLSEITFNKNKNSFSHILLLLASRSIVIVLEFWEIMSSSEHYLVWILFQWTRNTKYHDTLELSGQASHVIKNFAPSSDDHVNHVSWKQFSWLQSVIQKSLEQFSQKKKSSQFGISLTRRGFTSHWNWMSSSLSLVQIFLKWSLPFKSYRQ